MATRWPACTKAWISTSITNRVPPKHHPAEGFCLDPLPWSAAHSIGQRLSPDPPGSRRRSNQRNHSYDRALDAHFSSDHALSHSSAPHYGMELAYPLPPPAGTICLLLWLSA